MTDVYTELLQENSELKTKVFRLEQENRELKDEIQFHNKENSNLLAERNAAQIGYDEIREVRERYRSALEKIRDLCIHYENTNDKCVINCYAHFIVTDLIQNKINEVLNES